MTRKVHVFDNGVAVYDDHLIPAQRERYAKRNVHEAEEEELFVRIIRALPANGCFVNVGSAIGYYVLLAKKLSADLVIHAVEPLERHRKYFAENIELNGFSMIDFAIHSEAIAITERAVNFIDEGYGSALQARPRRNLRWMPSKFLFSRHAAKGEPMKENRSAVAVVKAITLDSLVSRIGRIVELLQMDVQGLEADVLSGGAGTLRSGQVKRFLIGTHGSEVHRKCVKQLRRYNYLIEIDKAETREQPDGILFASKGVTPMPAMEQLRQQYSRA